MYYRSILKITLGLQNFALYILRSVNNNRDRNNKLNNKGKWGIVGHFFFIDFEYFFCRLYF